MHKFNAAQGSLECYLRGGSHVWTKLSCHDKPIQSWPVWKVFLLDTEAVLWSFQFLKQHMHTVTRHVRRYASWCRYTCTRACLHAHTRTLQAHRYSSVPVCNCYWLSRDRLFSPPPNFCLLFACLRQAGGAGPLSPCRGLCGESSPGVCWGEPAWCQQEWNLGEW